MFGAALGALGGSGAASSIAGSGFGIELLNGALGSDGANERSGMNMFFRNFGNIFEGENPFFENLANMAIGAGLTWASGKTGGLSDIALKIAGNEGINLELGSDTDSRDFGRTARMS
jgi:hypothetical protein